MPGGFDTVLVVDFGAQYAQLIARRVRECHVYSEIVPSTMPAQDMLARHPKAIILSGGPSSVYADGAPPAPPGLFEAGVPILGICYGFQLLVAGLGLQAIGLGWLAAVASPTVPYLTLVPAFVVAGVGMSLFFAPVANVVLSSVRRDQEGIASGASNAIRELGGVLGIAVLGAVFSAHGSYASGAAFVSGLAPAVWVGGAAVAAAAATALLLPRSRRAAAVIPADEPAEELDLVR